MPPLSDFSDYKFIRMVVVSIISINFAVPFLKGYNYKVFLFVI